MKYYLYLFVMIIATSCNKDYNTIGINLITNKPFNTSVEEVCLLYTSPSPRDGLLSRMPSSA